MFCISEFVFRVLFLCTTTLELPGALELESYSSLILGSDLSFFFLSYEIYSEYGIYKIRSGDSRPIHCRYSCLCSDNRL